MFTAVTVARNVARSGVLVILRVNHVRSVYIYGQDFHEMHAHLRGLKSLLTLIKPDFPSLAGAIAELSPGMNIKVAAFSVSEKSINTTMHILNHILNSVV